MGAIYMENIVGVKNPRVAIVNIYTRPVSKNQVFSKKIVNEKSDQRSKGTGTLQNYTYEFQIP